MSKIQTFARILKSSQSVKANDDGVDHDIINKIRFALRNAFVGEVKKIKHSESTSGLALQVKGDLNVSPRALKTLAGMAATEGFELVIRPKANGVLEIIPTE